VICEKATSTHPCISNKKVAKASYLAKKILDFKFNPNNIFSDAILVFAHNLLKDFPSDIFVDFHWTHYVLTEKYDLFYMINRLSFDPDDTYHRSLFEKSKYSPLDDNGKIRKMFFDFVESAMRDETVAKNHEPGFRAIILSSFACGHQYYILELNHARPLSNVIQKHIISELEKNILESTKTLNILKSKQIVKK